MPSGVPDDFWDDSSQVIGDWAQIGDDDFYDDSPSVIGEWNASPQTESAPTVVPDNSTFLSVAPAAPVVHHDSYDDSPSVIGNWGLLDASPYDDFYDDSPSVIGDWAVASDKT